MVQAFILRISPSWIDGVPEALSTNEVIIGWSCAPGLLDFSLDWTTFREIVRRECYPDTETLRRPGAAAGHMWRFIRDMSEGDLVIVPYGSEFYVAEVTGTAYYDETKAHDDTAYRRPVKWLNGQQPISRSLARSALLSRMKTQGTSADATDLIEDIQECLKVAATGEAPSFQSDLQARLIQATLQEIRSGRLDPYGFESLVRTVLINLGAQEAWIVPRSQDVGVDLYASFRVAGAFRQLVAVQVKHWQPEPPADVSEVEQLIQGMQEGKESSSFGMLITSGTIANDAYEKATSYTEETGIPIHLVSGEDFAQLIVEYGVAIER